MPRHAHQLSLLMKHLTCDWTMRKIWKISLPFYILPIITTPRWDVLIHATGIWMWRTHASVVLIMQTHWSIVRWPPPSSSYYLKHMNIIFRKKKHKNIMVDENLFIIFYFTYLPLQDDTNRTYQSSEQKERERKRLCRLKLVSAVHKAGSIPICHRALRPSSMESNASWFVVLISTATGSLVDRDRWWFELVVDCAWPSHSGLRMCSKYAWGQNPATPRATHISQLVLYSCKREEK
jgi:hypothetical protein